MGEKPPKLNVNAPITPSGEPTIGSGNLSTSKKNNSNLMKRFKNNLSIEKNKILNFYFDGKKIPRIPGRYASLCFIG